jgi:pheromone shutdown protein TraB
MTNEQEIEPQASIELSPSNDSKEKHKNVKSIVIDDFYTIHLVGTAHVSEDSITEVSSFIEKVKPKIILIELCKYRQSLLIDQKEATTSDLIQNFWKDKSILKLSLSYFNLMISNKLKTKPV